LITLCPSAANSRDFFDIPSVADSSNALILSATKFNADMILFCKIDNKIEKLSKTAQFGCKITSFTVEKPHFL